MSISLIDATSDSLTLSWPEIPGAKRYLLEFRKADDVDDGAFAKLTDTLTTPQVRKKNLAHDGGDGGFFFRVSSASGEGVTLTHDEPFHLLTSDQEKVRMNAPKALLGGTLSSLRITWQANKQADGKYELQMRENKPGMAWSTIASSIQGTEVRKKNLTSAAGYHFRVRPAATDVPFSSPSDPVVALGLSPGLKQLFRSLENESLLRGDTPAPLADALGGKEFVLLYASAHWCGPCRQFTPMLVNWYNSQGGSSSTVEIVFLSADHDENGFKSYYKTMPWLAVQYDDDAREQLMGFIKVSGIPRLAVLDGRTGRIIEDNAVGKQLDVNRWRGLL